MWRLFYLGVAGIIIFEFLNVYLIMPMPGSQRMDSLDVAYFLYSNRWYFRVFFYLLTLSGAVAAFHLSKWKPSVWLIVAAAISYVFNFSLTAERMFEEPVQLTFASRAENTLTDSSLVIAVSSGEKAKAYPIRYIGYHHQVRDSLDGKPLMITYCTVCRTGKVFEPIVNGKPEVFRLVGMDHFNAMFEDASTQSWWRQVNGEAVAGPLIGMQLPEIESQQMTLGKFFYLYPDGKVMQADNASLDSYDSLAHYEKGTSDNQLTRRDTISWNDKAWVVGIEIGKASKAYDWNTLMRMAVINDVMDDVPVAIVLSSDGNSFAAFERPDSKSLLSIQNDTIHINNLDFDFNGNGISDPTLQLKKIHAYQEHWHSWRTFHPATSRYPN